MTQSLQDNMTAALAYALGKGAIPVCSAGNSRGGPSGVPARLPQCVSVSALGFNDTLAHYSSQGKVELAAPGGDGIGANTPGGSVGVGELGIWSTKRENDTYRYSNGTSMAAPHVSGVLAFLRGLHPNWSANQTLDVVFKTADDLGAPGFDPQFGFGKINAYRAVAQAPNPPKITLQGTPFLYENFEDIRIPVPLGSTTTMVPVPLTAAPGWNTTGLWHLTSHRVHRDESKNAMWYGFLNGTNRSYNTGDENEGFLTSPPISLASATSPVRLFFNSFESTDRNPQGDNLSIRIANHTLQFVPLWSSDQLIQRSWRPIDVAIPSSYNGGTIFLQFRLRADGFGDTGEGWLVDDVMVYQDPRLGVTLPGAPLPGEFKIQVEPENQSTPISFFVPAGTLAVEVRMQAYAELAGGAGYVLSNVDLDLSLYDGNNPANRTGGWNKTESRSRTDMPNSVYVDALPLLGNVPESILVVPPTSGGTWAFTVYYVCTAYRKTVGSCDSSETDPPGTSAGRRYANVSITFLADPTAGSFASDTFDGGSALPWNLTSLGLGNASIVTPSTNSSTYASSPSLYLNSSGGADAASALRELSDFENDVYSVEAKFRIPGGQSFSEFDLLRVQNETNQTIARVGFFDNDAILDASNNSSNALDVRSVAPDVWHALKLSVMPDNYLVYLDDSFVGQYKTNSASPPSTLRVGQGTGEAFFDDLQLYLGTPFMNNTFELNASSWNATRSQGIVERTTASVASTGSQVLRVRSNITDEGKNYFSHAIYGERDYFNIHAQVRLPQDLLDPVQYNNFTLIGLYNNSTPDFIAGLKDDNAKLDVFANGAWTMDAVDLGTNKWNSFLIEQRGRSTTLKVGTSTVAQVTLSGNRDIDKLLLGDNVAGIDAVNQQIGAGEAYWDDVVIMPANSAPTLTVSQPTAGQSVGGIATFLGTVSDPDLGDHVRTLAYKLGSGNWTAIPRARDWNTSFNTTTTPKGTYEFKVLAHDGKADTNVTRSIVIDNSPSVVITTPASGATVGGTVNITGTITDRYPIWPGDVADKIEIRIDSGAWTELATPQTSPWSWWHEWDTMAYAKGTHTISVRGTEGLDNVIVTRSVNVDNSPLITIDRPPSAPTPNVGDNITINGTVQDRFASNGSDVVDKLEYQIDSGAWTLLTFTGGNWSFRWNTTTLANGTHTLRLRGTEGLDTTIKTLDTNVQNGPDGSVTLSSGVPRYAELVATGDDDVYAFNIPLGGPTQAMVSVSDGPDDANFDLEVSNGVLTWSSTGSGSDETVNIQSPAPGAYTIRIYSVSGLGEYKLTVTLFNL